MEKTCSKCGEVKPLEEFHRNQLSNDGRVACCKACRKAHYEANREQIRRQQKVYRESNREQIHKRDKAYREANREQILERQRAYREANREQIRRQHKAHREANREQILRQKRAYREANREQLRRRQRAYREANLGQILERRNANTAALTDAYIKQLLRIPNPSPELIEFKREQLMLYRLMRDIFKEINDASDRPDADSLDDESDT